MCEKYNILSVYNIYTLRCVQFCKKHHLEDFKDPRSTHRTRSHTGGLFVPNYRFEVSKQTILYKAPWIYNKLRKNICDSERDYPYNEVATFAKSASTEQAISVLYS